MLVSLIRQVAIGSSEEAVRDEAIKVLNNYAKRRPLSWGRDGASAFPEPQAQASTNTTSIVRIPNFLNNTA